MRYRIAELESGLADGPALYLVLDPANRKLEVRARGRTLSQTPLHAIALLTFRPFLDRSEAPPLEAPAIWRVVRGPGDTDRETIAPTTLRPYSEEEERTEPAPAAGATPQPNPENRKPATYRVALDNGWQLLISDEPPRFGWFRRFAAAVRDGWLRLRGGEPAHPPLVALTVSSEDARALHHLFRSGIEILVLPAG